VSYLDHAINAKRFQQVRCTPKERKLEWLLSVCPICFALLHSDCNFFVREEIFIPMKINFKLLFETRMRCFLAFHLS